VPRRARPFGALALGAVFAVAALAAARWVSPLAGWAVIVLVLAVAYVRARRGMTRRDD
jgi:UDP-N-acetylmuramyl pentapeptide phosphotransferase/UDP-N-acetylglucosamine-1-phosphate transferase